VKIAAFVASIYLVFAFEARTLGGLWLGFDQPDLLIRIPVFVLSVAAYLAVHECGHRLAGAVQGWRCVRFGFGPWNFVRDRHGWQVHRVKWLWGAFVRQLPPGFERFRRQKAGTLLGGPLTSLTFGAVCAFLALRSATGGEYWLFASLAVWSPLGFFELVPYRFAAGQSDGASLWQIRNLAGSDAMQREMFAETSNLTKLRYRDWPRDVIERLLAPGGDYNAYLAYVHYLDSGDLASASRAMSRLVEEKHDANAPYYACEAAWFFAIHGGDAAEARNWLELGRTCPDRHAVTRAAAGVAWAEGDVETAEKFAKEALAEHDAVSPTGEQAYEIGLLRSLLNRCESVPV